VPAESEAAEKEDEERVGEEAEPGMAIGMTGEGTNSETLRTSRM